MLYGIVLFTHPESSYSMEMQEISTRSTVPIHFIDKTGKTTEKWERASPVIAVGFLFDPKFSTGPNRKVDGHDGLLALVDTGADLNYADPSLLAKHRCPVSNFSTVQSATSQIASTIHIGHLLCPGGRLIETDFVSAPLIKNGRIYSLILGLHFLKLGRLELDFARKIFRFTFAD
jgi:hypothetical protein